MRDARIDKLAEVLIHYCTGVRRGEVVSLVGPPLTQPLILALYREVLKAGSHPLVVMAPETCTEILYQVGSPEQLAAYFKAEGEKWSRVIRDAKIKAE